MQGSAAKNPKHARNRNRNANGCKQYAIEVVDAKAVHEDAAKDQDHQTCHMEVSSLCATVLI